MTRAYIVGAISAIERAGASDRDVGEGASEETIQRAEEMLRLRFPPSYRAFLMAFGYGGTPEAYVYGICDSFDLTEPAAPNVVGINIEERRAGHPDHVLLIENRGPAGYYALDFSTCDQSGETAVIEWVPGADPRATQPRVADDFGQFLLERVAAAHAGKAPAAA